MKTITTHEAKTHLSKYLVEVGEGETFIIARGKKPVAMLVPLKKNLRKPRPKVGDIDGEPFVFPSSAFSPLTNRELEDWGL